MVDSYPGVGNEPKITAFVTMRMSHSKKLLVRTGEPTAQNEPRHHLETALDGLLSSGYILNSSDNLAEHRRASATILCLPMATQSVDEVGAPADLFSLMESLHDEH